MALRMPRSIGRPAEARAKTFAPIIAECVAKGMSARTIARELEARKAPTPKGGAWLAATVLLILKRLETAARAALRLAHRAYVIRLQDLTPNEGRDGRPRTGVRLTRETMESRALRWKFAHDALAQGVFECIEIFRFALPNDGHAPTQCFDR
jgi:hypothetical protein